MMQPSSVFDFDPAATVDIALGKSATQSSTSPWSHENESGNPVSGRDFPDYAFHTQEEDDPWWCVDLGAVYAIESIVVHNRVAMLQQRAARLRVEIGETEDDWSLIHAGYCFFGSDQDGGPLVLRVGSRLLGRYVRLSLDERNPLHLSKVQVFVRSELATLAEFCRRTRLPYYAPTSPESPYKLVRHPESRNEEIVGIAIDYSGRFGNLLIQYINIIQMAERAGLKFIKLGEHELFAVKSEFEVNGVRFIPHDHDLPPVGTFLAGEFFNSDDLTPLLSPFLRYGPEEERDAGRVCQDYIIPHILTGVPASDEQKLREELTIHLRSGDVFNSDDGVTYGYRQPPLSFYKLVIDRMREAGRIRRVRLVFEDRGNPCVDALEGWLTQQGVAYRVQNASLKADLSALVDAPHLVFGQGSFGYAAIRLSRRVETVHFYAPQLGGSYEHMPNVGEVYCVGDKGDYIKAYEYGKEFGPEEGWRRTPQMYRKMLTYPLGSLTVERLK